MSVRRTCCNVVYLNHQPVNYNSRSYTFPGGNMVAKLAQLDVTCLCTVIVCLTFTILTSEAVDSRVPSSNFINKHRPSSNNLDWSASPPTGNPYNSVVLDRDDADFRKPEDRRAWRLIGRRSTEEASVPDDVIATDGNAYHNRNRRASNHQSFFVRIGRGPTSKDDIRSDGPRHRRSHALAADNAAFDGSDDRWIVYDQSDEAVKRGLPVGASAGLDDSYEKRGPNSFMRLGRSQIGNDDVVKRGPNSFMRLGRSRDNAGSNYDTAGQTELDNEYEVKRGPNSFMRLGRSRNYPTEVEDMLEKSGVKDNADDKRGPNSFMRLGRSPSSTTGDENALEQPGNAKAATGRDLQHQMLAKSEKSSEIEKRGPSSFLKIGRRSTNEE